VITTHGFTKVYGESIAVDGLGLTTPTVGLLTVIACAAAGVLIAYAVALADDH
jgi:hypothetical protein